MEEIEKKPEVTIGEYKGSPVISLPLTADGKYPFTFGLSKAKIILKYIDDINKFVEKYDIASHSH
jgi:hypothetical protein